MAFPNHNAIDDRKEAKVVPDGDEGDAQEKAQGSSKFCDQGRKGINQLFCGNPCVFRNCPQREGDIVSWKDRGLAVSKETVFLVLARLDAVRKLGDGVQISPSYLIKHSVVFPDY